MKTDAKRITYSDSSDGRELANPNRPHMTIEQARQFGDRNMPNDLRRAGFKTFVFVSDIIINGGEWYRITYGK